VSTELTAVSTHGWFASEGYQQDLLRSVGTFGWYGTTIGDLVEFFKTVDFTLIVKRLEEIGLEIKTEMDIEGLDIMTVLSTPVTITRIKDFTLER
jgi:hypothetical protein